ncbi:hypothetical protein, partial [Streptomyces himalayensis]|uniref:hypothetical protein n=1 Tax=Streptomyces himalayensis TaxID=2820085 RepID=UPI001C6A5E0D
MLQVTAGAFIWPPAAGPHQAGPTPPPSPPRRAQPTVQAILFDVVLTALSGCTRPEAWTLARAWANAGCVSREEVLGWASIVGL